MRLPVLASCVLNPSCPFPSLWVPAIGFHGAFPLFHCGHSVALTRRWISITASAGALSALKHTSAGSDFLHNLFLPPSLNPPNTHTHQPVFAGKLSLPISFSLCLCCSLFASTSRFSLKCYNAGTLLRFGNKPIRFLLHYLHF